MTKVYYKYPTQGQRILNRIAGKHTYLVLLFLVLSANASVFSQTITSVANGGNWSSPATWIGNAK